MFNIRQSRPAHIRREARLGEDVTTADVANLEGIDNRLVVDDAYVRAQAFPVPVQASHTRDERRVPSEHLNLFAKT